jgi:PKD repeat protein
MNMKTILGSVFAIFITITGYSQTVCGTDYFLEKEYKENPSFQNEVEQNWMVSDGPTQQAEGARALSIIPVVFHIFHDNGVGNITYDQIQSAMKMINDDFRRLNSDAVNTRSIFTPYAVDSEVEFRLAQVDPDGNCTNGVVRINDPAASHDAGNNVKPLSRWPSNKYFNVWVVNDIESSGVPGIILGYAQFPGSGSWNTYGIVIRNDRVGTVGTASTGDRTLTHEIGHCLNLLHTFQSGCGNNCQSSGDRVCDTPPVNNSTQPCALNQNQCSNDASGNSVYNTDVVDQIENYMSYNDCQNMFSSGQKTRIQNALNNFNTLIQLTSSSNLIATGVLNTNPGVCKAEFDVNNTVVCVGQSVEFTDLSYFNPKTYNWDFEGGFPNVSHVKNPVISYTAPGKYKVQLTIIDSTNSSVSTLKTNYITVLSSQGNTVPAQESFEFASALVGNNWFSDSLPTGIAWEKTTFGGSSGSNSLKANAYLNNGKLSVTSPVYDVSNLTDATVTFDHAYAPRTNEGNNFLRVFVSSDCGETWKLRKVLGGPAMGTTSSISSQYSNPSSGDWVNNSFVVPSSLLLDKMRIKFEFTANDGNNIFIDNINITGTLSSDVILKSPMNGAQNLSVNQLLNWNATNTVDNYIVEMDTDPAFNSPNLVTQQINYISGSSNNADTEFQTNNLNDGITYYWRVRTTLNGTSSVWSPVWSFKVDASVVGVSNVEKSNTSILVYPNPAYDQINVDLDLISSDDVQIMLFDITGNLIQNIYSGTLQTGKSHFQIQRNGLSQGVYLIQTITSEGMKTSRVVFN